MGVSSGRKDERAVVLEAGSRTEPVKAAAGEVGRWAGNSTLSILGMTAGPAPPAQVSEEPIRHPYDPVTRDSELSFVLQEGCRRKEQRRQGLGATAFSWSHSPKQPRSLGPRLSPLWKDFSTE